MFDDWVDSRWLTEKLENLFQLHSSHLLFGYLVTLVTFMFLYRFCLNKRTNIGRRTKNEEKVFQVKSQQKKNTKTGCVCCHREATKRATSEEEDRNGHENENQIEAQCASAFESAILSMQLFSFTTERRAVKNGALKQENRMQGIYGH